MAIHSRASIRYARALLMAAEQTDGLHAVKVETRSMRDLISESPELQAFLDDPTIAMQDKLVVLERLFAAKLSPLMWRFVRLLTGKHRERLLPDILDATLTLIDEREGRVQADVTSAVPVDPDQRARLKERLESITGKEIVLQTQEDPALVTGFVARVGDTVYDASLTAQLGRLRQQLGEANL